MIILTIRTDKPEAEIGLYGDNEQLAYETWQAHRELAETIHLKIRDLLESQGKAWKDIEGIVAFQGPGSFTGLRIGLTVANALAYAQGIPVVSTLGEGWIPEGVNRLLSGENDKIAMPEYGAEANITKPRK
jgi:tRNA threonylcarbamoyladenosine biosynthesis protein TsaB